MTLPFFCFILQSMKEEKIKLENIKVKYGPCVVECSCGNKFETRSTLPYIKVEVCSVCHPFYTGKQKFIDTAGRVEKFQAKVEAAKKAQEKIKKKKESKGK